MASLLARLTGAPFGVQGANIKPADVSARIEAAEAGLRALQLRYGPLAFRADQGEPEAVADLATLRQQLRDAEDRIRDLNATLAEAERLDRLATEIARENLFNSQAAAVRAHFAKAKAGAAKIAEAEGLRTEGWRELTTHMDKAKAACPVGFSWPDTWPNIEHLALLARNETYRIGGEGLINGTASPHSLPGYNVPGGYVNLPDKITPLAAEIAGFTDYVNAELKAHADGFKAHSDA